MSIPQRPLSRRGFLSATGGVSLAALGLSACSRTDEKSAGASTLKLLLPGAVPTGWQPVLDAVNKKLEGDLGFSIAPQFINWSNYGNQALLKFTAGEKFETALQARWLNMTQLVGSGSVIAVDELLASGKYPNLQKTLSEKLLTLNKWGGKLYGIPQVNSAARIQHFSIRQDLAERYGAAEIGDYQSLEKFWYDVKQRNPGITPVGLSSNTTNLTAIPNPVALFGAYSWDNPDRIGQNFTGDSIAFFMAADAKSTGSAKPVPFWEIEGLVDTLHTIRKYYTDGIINRDVLNTDSATIDSRFTSGKVASVWAMTDGQSSNKLPALQKAVKGAQLANVIPLRGGKSAKPNQTFQADNFVVLNKAGQSNERAMQLEDWLSIKANHDLISYGIEGKDWKPVGKNQFSQLSTYAFPGYALCWRNDLELRSSFLTATEADWFDWAQKFDNFTVDPFATFIPDVTPVKKEDAQITAAFTQYANPLFVGAVDVTSGLDKLKKAVSAAGLDKVQAEMEKQANAFLAANK